MTPILNIQLCDLRNCLTMTQSSAVSDAEQSHYDSVTSDEQSHYDSVTDKEQSHYDSVTDKEHSRYDSVPCINWYVSKIFVAMRRNDITML